MQTIVRWQFIKNRTPLGNKGVLGESAEKKDINSRLTGKCRDELKKWCGQKIIKAEFFHIYLENIP